MQYIINRFFLVLLNIQLSFNLSAQTMATVGWSSDCDYNESIMSDQIEQAVVDGHAEIRVTNSQPFLEPVAINAASVIIKGGYDNCTDADNDIQSATMTQLQGDNFTESAIFIASADTPINISIENFEIFNSSGGNGTNNNFAGGINVIDTAGQLSFKNLNIHHNPNNFAGGGIAILNSLITNPLQVNMSDVILSHNSAGTGGGLECKSNGLTEINIGGQSGFSYNQAGHQGGGLYLDNCDLTFNGGTMTPSTTDLQGIHANTALNNGGGIQILNKAHVVLSGTTQTPFNITNNSANDGGGVQLNGFNESGTLLELTNSWVADNKALNRYGGAVLSDFEAVVVFKSSGGCLWNDLCHLVDGNTADDNGGAFYIANGGIVELNKVEVTGSRSGLSGAVAGLRNDQSSLTINNSLIHHNGGIDHTAFNDYYVIRNLSGEANISINYSSFADNDVQFATIVPFANSTTELFGNFNLIGSIIADDVTALSNPPAPAGWTATSVVNCVMFKEISTSEDAYLIYEQVIEGEPMFVNPANGNYRLDALETTAIDRCDEVNYPAILPTDVDDQIRPYDTINIDNEMGSLDIGYDEVNLDLIFKHGFE